MHDGYQDGEVPDYAECFCGRVVRVDRADLVREHRETCADWQAMRAHCIVVLGVDLERASAALSDEVRERVPPKMVKNLLRLALPKKRRSSGRGRA